MADNLFQCQPKLASYERAEILREFSMLAQTTGGQLNPQALRLNKKSQIIIEGLHWQGLQGEVVLQHSWTMLVTLRLFLPKAVTGQVRLSNVYGETSGTPLIGPPRLEANWTDDDLMALLPPHSYRMLTSTAEPYSLLLDTNQICLTTYRYYTKEFYIRALAFLAQVAQKAMEINPQTIYWGRTRPVELPWM